MITVKNKKVCFGKKHNFFATQGKMKKFGLFVLLISLAAAASSGLRQRRRTRHDGDDPADPTTTGDGGSPAPPSWADTANLRNLVAEPYNQRVALSCRLDNRVFIKYCVFWKYSGLWPFSVFPRCQCVYTHQAVRKPALQQNWQSSENHKILRKKHNI